MADEKDKKHPSYGVVNVSRVSAGPPGHRLFDSPFRHQHFITITIGEAYKYRSLHEDKVGGTGKEFITVAMSEVQYARMLSSPNQGVGVPCTITDFGGKHLAEPPPEGQRETYSNEMKTALKDFRDMAKELDAISNKTEWRAAEKARMRELTGTLFRAADGNLAFLMAQFEEFMEGAVSSARAEITAHVQSVVQQAGLKAIKEGDEPLRLELDA